ncbi:general substrate transporter, partial [Aureobasidium melanogenum]|jgi:SP family general alpha glucoside:H+ symporter-like MFS transporter
MLEEKEAMVYIEDQSASFVGDEKTNHGMAAAATDEEHNLTLMQALKKYPQACFWSIAISSAIIMEGYDIVLIYSFFGQPAFVKKYGEYDAAAGKYTLSAAWQAGLGNATQIGTVIGAFLNGYLAHKFGYRKVMVASLLSLLAFVFISFFAPTIEVILIGQILCGIPWGVFATMAPAYASEVCPTVLRGYLTVYVNLTWAFGQLVGAGVQSALSGSTTEWAYRIPFAIQWVWPLPIALLAYCAPESPWYLIRTGNSEGALSSIKRLSPTKTECEHRAQLAMMQHTNQLEMDISAGTSYWDCFKGIDRRRTEIVCMVFAAQPFCGSAMGGTPTYFFIQAGLPTSISFKMTVGGLGIASVGTIISWYLLSAFGRRTLYLWGLGLLAIILIITGAISAADATSVAGNYAQAVMMLLWLAIYYLTVGPICYAIIGETSATRLRNKSVCLARIAYDIANITCGAVNPYLLNPTALNWKGKTGFFWAGTTLVFFLWTFFRLPECKGRTYEELDVLFANKVKTREFKKFNVNVYAQDGETLVKQE